MFGADDGVPLHLFIRSKKWKHGCYLYQTAEVQSELGMEVRHERLFRFIPST